MYILINTVINLNEINHIIRYWSVRSLWDHYMIQRDKRIYFWRRSLTRHSQFTFNQPVINEINHGCWFVTGQRLNSTWGGLAGEEYRGVVLPLQAGGQPGTWPQQLFYAYSNFLRSDHRSFWEYGNNTGLKAVFLTDTGIPSYCNSYIANSNHY